VTVVVSSLFIFVGYGNDTESISNFIIDFCVISYGLDCWGSFHDRVWNISVRHHVWGPPSLLSNMYEGHFLRR